jgi:hypothetical protein
MGICDILYVSVFTLLYFYFEHSLSGYRFHSRGGCISISEGIRFDIIPIFLYPVSERSLWVCAAVKYG